jgi:spore maturation protein SpmA
MFNKLNITYRQILVCLSSVLLIISLSSCGFETLMRKPHTVIIDTTNMAKDLQEGLQSYMTLEILFARKTFLSGKLDTQINTLLKNIFKNIESNKNATGYHIYQIFDYKISNDKVFIPRTIKKMFFVVKRNSQIIHTKEININPKRTKHIIIKFVGYDVYAQIE